MSDPLPTVEVMRDSEHQTALDLGDGVDRPAAVDAGRVPLHEVTFVVVDLETTGGCAQDDRITEFGAVKVRGGEVLGEFATLVSPGRAVPAAVTALTGISDSMLRNAPPIGAVLPTFLEFAAGSVLVAHNAGFDMSFLRAACLAQERPWPDPVVVDTVRLARLVVSLDEVPNHRLGTLAAHLHATVTPTHRALDDARATVDVLHALLARMSGVQTLADLRDFGLGATVPQARQRHLAQEVPRGPGVYEFLDAAGRVLYVGSAGDLRARVRTYFTKAERRRRMSEMVAITSRLAHTRCPTLLEARVREVRRIAALRPPYNRRSTHPERSTWLVLTDEVIPRLSLVRAPGGRTPLAVWRTRTEAGRALAALEAVAMLRTCTTRLRRGGGAAMCVLGEIGRCLAPCVTGVTETYRQAVAGVRQALLAGPEPLVQRIRDKLADLSTTQRYERAAELRDGLHALVQGVERAQRLASLQRLGRSVAAKRTDAGGWDIVHLVGGRLAGTAVSPPGLHPRATMDVLLATSDLDPAQPALLDEADLVWNWLCGLGVRLVESRDGWWLPARGAGGVSELSSPPPSAATGRTRRHRRSPRGPAPADHAMPP